MELEDKLKKLLHHWAHHGQEHVESYLEWAKKARGAGMNDVAGLLEDAADSTREALERIKEAEYIFE